MGVVEKDNMIGKIFNRLTVIKYSHKDKYGSKMYLCRCVCGNTTIARRIDLSRGYSGESPRKKTKFSGNLSKRSITIRFLVNGNTA